MAARHATEAARFDACGAVAFADVGGSGLIVVVIVAAWALFLVPQWLHKRASAAAHLADRLPEDGMHDVDDPAEPGEAAHEQRDGADRASRRFGRRSIARRRSGGNAGGPSSRWFLPTLPGVGRRAGRHRAPMSAAARRRRIVAWLALATLATAVGVVAATVAGLAVPTWLVALPGGLMVGYLLLLVVLRPGAASRDAARLVRAPDEAAEAHARGEMVRRRAPRAQRVAVSPSASTLEASSPADAGMLAAPARTGSLSDAVPPSAAADLASAPPAADPTASSDTWTPVPLPTPTYVTAPRAQRSVRTIDLSNPGSWTSSSHLEPPTTTADLGSDEENDDYPVEHRRAVGD